MRSVRCTLCPFSRWRKSTDDATVLFFLGIGFSKLATLSMQDYSEVGVTNMPDRRKLFELIQMVKRYACSTALRTPLVQVLRDLS